MTSRTAFSLCPAAHLCAEAVEHEACDGFQVAGNAAEQVRGACLLLLLAASNTVQVRTVDAQGAQGGMARREASKLPCAQRLNASCIVDD